MTECAENEIACKSYLSDYQNINFKIILIVRLIYIKERPPMSTLRQPTLFISHGGGPSFWMDYPPPIGPHGFDKLRNYLAGLIASLPQRPKAILVISGHWEEDRVTVSTASAPPMLFDYYGFPPHTYQLNYPAPGAPALAARARGLLGAAGIASDENGERGFDHGVFVPFLIVDPQAQIPVLMGSLEHHLDAARHLAIGAALAPLRDEGVLIVGSGNSFHNMRAFFDGRPEISLQFDRWLTEAVALPDPSARAAALTAWDRAPAARLCHPREEHLIPLMVAAGAAPDERGTRVFHDIIGGKAISGFAFGV
jgi:aromatic ring-opening dioxygenase catalytic subunit (LigB family)